MITIDEKDFEAKVLNAMYKEVTSAVFRNKETCVDEIKALVKSSCDNSPEVKSMYSSLLRAEFGFRKGQEEQYVQPIIDTIINSIELKVKPSFFQSYISTACELSIVNVDFDTLLDLPKSEYVSRNSRGDYRLVRWLAWLLFAGTKVVVYNYDISYNLTSEQRSRSRSGSAIMVHSEDGTYRVPPEYSGTESDNFITRIFDDSMAKDITYIVENILLRGMT